MAQARGVVEVSLANANATGAELAGVLGAADADTDLVGGHPLDELLGDTSAKLAGDSGDDDHEGLLCWRRQSSPSVSDDSAFTVPQILSAITRSCYHWSHERVSRRCHL
jgi:hypothetical protein